MVTAVGTKTLNAVDPLPIWPEEFEPQQYIVPVDVKAQVCTADELVSIDVKATPEGMVTARGVRLGETFVPLPPSPA